MKKVWLQIFITKKIPKEGVPCKCSLDSVLKSYKNYHPQTFSEECKYVQEKTKSENYINDNLDSGSDDETKSDNDEYEK